MNGRGSLSRISLLSPLALLAHLLQEFEEGCNTCFVKVLRLGYLAILELSTKIAGLSPGHY